MLGTTGAGTVRTRGIDCIETRWHALPEVLAEMIGAVAQLCLRLSLVDGRL